MTYGPFRPQRDGGFFPEIEQVRTDFASIRSMGANVVRLYHVPPRWLLDECVAHGLRALITIPWPEHVQFLNDRKIRAQIVATVRDAVAANKGHNAVFAYLVGNEIPAAIARWLGPRRVTRFIERLINVARSADPRPLFSYASFPPTEYLLPGNVDFFTFNVYLHRRTDFERYLARLQNLAGEKPLLFGEFGMDTIRHTEEEQAALLGWHIESCVRGGAAGTVLFSWTDEWFTGGVEVSDWAFGLVTHDRKPKRALAVVRELFSRAGTAAGRFPLARYPSVSVIVCSYNGSLTLRDCLESLNHIEYPDYEIVLVDDGSTDNTQQIVAAFEKQRAETIARGEKLPAFKNIVQENLGLSGARQAGARAAGGEVLAYTDSDCMPDSDWLYFLTGTLLSGDYAGVGGPNIPPPAVDWIQAAVAASPGAPSHVLFSDVHAEHIPGCNMAFYRWAIESVGGFDPEFRKAGDDVDFCWRLEQTGLAIAFSPAAIVWHYRRFTLRDFRLQQEGYGEAESILRLKHHTMFGPTGTAKWRGQIYGTPRFSWLMNRPLIYHGALGRGMFQSIYPVPQSIIAAYLGSLEWVALTALIASVSVRFPALRAMPAAMFAGTALVALSYAANAHIEPRFDSLRARLLVAFLAFMQPIGRGWARHFAWLKFKRTPRKVIEHPEESLAPSSPRGSASRLQFWSTRGTGQRELLAATFARLDAEGWRWLADSGWENWDAKIFGSYAWSVTLRSVTEYHGGGDCLTRVRLRSRPVRTTVLAGVLVLSLMTSVALLDAQLTLPVCFATAVAGGVLAWRARRSKRRVADVVLVAAKSCGLQLMLK